MFGAARMLTVPDPDPGLPDRTANQSDVLSAVQSQPLRAVTVTSKTSPATGTVRLLGEMSYSQAGGGLAGGGGAGAGGGGGVGAGAGGGGDGAGVGAGAGGGGGGAGVGAGAGGGGDGGGGFGTGVGATGGAVTGACCSTVKGKPATTSVAFRSAPLLAVTENLTSPLPLPEAFCRLSQSAVAEATQLHPSSVAMATDPTAPDGGTTSLVRSSSKRQGAASSAIRTRWSPTATKADRDVAFGLAATENVTVPLPWPLAGDVKASHSLSLVAVQEHSRSVVTATLPFPPAEGNELTEADAETRHLLPEGPTMLVDAEPPQPGSAGISGSRKRTAGARENRLAVIHGPWATTAHSPRLLAARSRTRAKRTS